MPAARADDFAPFTAYCRQRLDDDPHLRAPALLAEITLLGFPGTRQTFYRALERHEIRPHPCPDCHIARISGYAPLSRGQADKAVPAAAARIPGDRGNAGIIPQPPRRRQPHQHRGPAGGTPVLVRRQGTLARRPMAARPANSLGRRRRRPARRDQRHHRHRDQERTSRLRLPRIPARPRRHSVSPLHRGPAHQPASPCSPARAPPGLPPARHLAIQDRNTAIQRQRMPRHHGRRAPGTPAPPAQHRRTAHPRQDPGRTGTRRPCCPAGMETADARTHHVKLADGRRVMPAGTVRCGGLPRNRRHGRQHDHPVTRHSEQSSLTQANPRAPTTRQIGQWPLRQVSHKIPQPRTEPRTEDDWMTPDRFHDPLFGWFQKRHGLSRRSRIRRLAS